MEIKELHSWADFDDVVNEIAQSREVFIQSNPQTFPANLLFRGQADASWSLKTTLERTVGQNYKLSDYYRLISRVRTRIETFTDRTWEIMAVQDYQDWLAKTDFMALHNIPPSEYKYMFYLRHHGFPSPLLDWTESPYIAAYFAFRDIFSKAEAISVFAYLEHFGTKGGTSYQPFINVLGPNIHSDERHFLQQSNYTICTTGEGEQAYYSSHEEVFTGGNAIFHDPEQDVLWKIIIPISERSKAIKKLESYNINAYSLFRSEESLMETVFLRDFFR